MTVRSPSYTHPQQPGNVHSRRHVHWWLRRHRSDARPRSGASTQHIRAAPASPFSRPPRAGWRLNPPRLRGVGAMAKPRLKRLVLASRHSPACRATPPQRSRSPRRAHPPFRPSPEQVWSRPRAPGGPFLQSRHPCAEAQPRRRRASSREPALSHTERRALSLAAEHPARGSE